MGETISVVDINILEFNIAGIYNNAKKSPDNGGSEAKFQEGCENLSEDAFILNNRFLL